MNVEIMTGLPESYGEEMIEVVNASSDIVETEAYARGYEDGYDQACMDMTDDELCGMLDEDCGMCFGASFNDCDDCHR